MKNNSISCFMVLFLLCVFTVVLPMQAMAMVQTSSASASMDTENKPDTTPRGFTPKGNATVIDNVKTENEKELFTISTQNKNIYYLIVDRAREGENVYFLNEVTEQDLFSLTDTGQETKEVAVTEPKELVCNCIQKCDIGMVNAGCEVCSIDLKKCAGTAENTQKITEIEKKDVEKTTEKGTLIFLAAGVAIAVIAGYYFKVYRPKQEYIDDEEEAMEEETFINEDEEETEKNQVSAVEYYDDVPDEYIGEE